jgi:hypothetical protein
MPIERATISPQETVEFSLNIAEPANVRPFEYLHFTPSKIN